MAKHMLCLSASDHCIVAIWQLTAIIPDWPSTLSAPFVFHSGIKNASQLQSHKTACHCIRILWVSQPPSDRPCPFPQERELSVNPPACKTLEILWDAKYSGRRMWALSHDKRYWSCFSFWYTESLHNWYPKIECPCILQVKLNLKSQHVEPSVQNRSYKIS